MFKMIAAYPWHRSQYQVKTLQAFFSFLLGKFSTMYFVSGTIFGTISENTEPVLKGSETHCTLLIGQRSIISV